MSEIGPNGFTKFGTSKQFVSWARLAPINKIWGKSNSAAISLRVAYRLKIALRQAANAIR
jgi:hypothetical protein